MEHISLFFFIENYSVQKVSDIIMVDYPYKSVAKSQTGVVREFSRRVQATAAQFQSPKRFVCTQRCGWTEVFLPHQVAASDGTLDFIEPLIVEPGRHPEGPQSAFSCLLQPPGKSRPLLLRVCRSLPAKSGATCRVSTGGSFPRADEAPPHQKDRRIPVGR